MWEAADLNNLPIPTNEELLNALEERHGSELHKKLRNASVAVCGLGGLGSNIAVLLARAGVGKLHLIDFDKVDISNLNRQQYLIHQPGMYKTDALSEIIRSITPLCEIKTHRVKIDEDNFRELLKDEPIVCEAFDGAEQKAMLVNGVLESFPEKYLVSGSGMAGISSSNLIRTRKVARRFYLCGDEKSDVAEGLGLVSARVMVCAAHQANMIIRIIAEEYEP